ncbi:hypothetical protein, partial [Klebsiella pneumoniae]|uniref:hypothetical protein n=1 Tax=Klebsiella pneumoniae TaxID=573 RepID=UPI0029DCD577
QIREILISESAWEEMTCLFAPSLVHSFFISAKFLCICDPDHARNFMLIECYWNGNKCQAIQRMSKDCQDNDP